MKSNNKDTLAMAEILTIQQEIELYDMDWYDPTCYAIEILDAKKYLQMTM